MIYKINSTKDEVSTMKFAELCSLIAETAGFMHDLGKFNIEFQNKLNKKVAIQDNVRHEWISMFLAKHLIDGLSWIEAVDKVVNNPKKFCNNVSDTLIFEDHLCSITDALLFCIATHHKLPRKNNGDFIDSGHHIKNNIDFENPKIPYSPKEKLFSLIKENLNKIKSVKIETTEKLYWRAIATISRMALILADQSVSAEYHPHINNSNIRPVYANTHGKDRQLNQELCWHLENVGYKAGKMVFEILNITLPSLTSNAIEQITEKSSGRFEWQNQAFSALVKSANQNIMPHLVLNVAGTGSGKTRMNLKAICALNENKPVRVAAALNLRTLTLQTGDAYRYQIGIKKEEMACVIGDSMTQKLHESKYKNVDEDESESSIEVESYFKFVIPDWLRFYSDKNPKLCDIIGAPLLVSTVDFLVAAGEPYRKHHHILAGVRIMHSDLILDEIDGYEPLPLLSILRIVTLAALFGRNVIASSATLSKPVAGMLWEAYNHGNQMRSFIFNKQNIFTTAIIDDLTTPTIEIMKATPAFLTSYESHINRLILQLKDKPYRVPRLAEITTKTKEGWLDTIKRQVENLHEDHGWNDPITNTKISFGLVRIANTTKAIRVANYLSKTIPNCNIVCYHSYHFHFQRFLIEKSLDLILTRKGDEPNKNILSDQEIREILDKNNAVSVPFIVVATPVEEIGRDHDFDWAVIEPSSSQSIVQTAGRVNRHRLVHVNKPNIAILQFCYKGIENKKIVFEKPGLEFIVSENVKDKSTHPSHDLKELFKWNQIDQVDSRMRFCSDIHPFAAADDKAIELKTHEIFRSLKTEDHLWMAKETYTDSSLRSFQPSMELLLIDPTNPNKYKIKLDNNEVDYEVHISKYISAKQPSKWLIKSDFELIDEAKKLSVEMDKMMSVSISVFDNDKKIKHENFIEQKVRRHQTFGFYIDDSNSLV